MGTGIPVPATIPDGSKAFIICVPDDPFFYGVVMGAIKTMTFRYFWDGTEDQKDEVTERMLRMYYEYQDQEGCMICAMIIDCINSDPDTKAALLNWFVTELENNTELQQALNDNYNPIAPGQNMPPDVLAESLTPDNPTCNLDALFGQVSTFIDKMNQNNLDAFEIIEAETNLAERVSELVQAVPGLGILPIDEIIDYAQNLWSDDLFEAYAATDTEGYRNELKCALFCLAQDNDCTLTLEMVLQYFGDRLGSDPSDTLADIIIYLLAGTWSGTEVNDLFYYAQAVLMKYGNEFFGLTGLNTFKIWLQLAEPDDTWPIICEECPPDCIAPEFRIVNPGGFDGGSVDVVDNMDGTWTVTGTSALDAGDTRLAFVEANGCCWNVLSVSYTYSPSSLNNHYECGANPTNEDYAAGSAAGAITVDTCTAGAVCGQVGDSPLTITITVEAC